jgi:hypothetical protein
MDEPDTVTAAAVATIHVAFGRLKLFIGVVIPVPTVTVSSSADFNGFKYGTPATMRENATHARLLA